MPGQGTAHAGARNRTCGSKEPHMREQGTAHAGARNRTCRGKEPRMIEAHFSGKASLGVKFMFDRDAKIIKVGGGDLFARLASVNEQRLKAKEPQCYWIGYTFPLRPDIALEAVRINADGSQTNLGIITGSGPAHTTVRAGVFLLYDGENTDLTRPTRVKLCDLDRKHDWEGTPVYWLDQIDASHSLEFLQRLIAESLDADASECLMEAVAVHSHPGVEALLKKEALGSSFAEARMAAIRWLGRTGHLHFLAEIVTDTDEDHQVRMQAIMSIGKSTDPTAVALLCGLYETLDETSLKTHVLTALSKQHHRPSAENFLRAVSESEADSVLGLHSRAKLDKARGKKKLKKTKVKPLLKWFGKSAAGF